MKPAVYIPNLNGGEMLARALESLAPLGEARVVVVDNGSEDDSVTMLKERFPEVELIALPENIGFGRALNLAVARVPGDPLIFLNNDVECEPGFLRELLGAATPEMDMVAGVLLQADRPESIDTAGVVVEGDTLMGFDYLHGEPVERLESARPPLGPCGGAALFRRASFESLGGFDERIFVYLEDVDLALRAAAGGMSCGLASRARVRHAYSATLGGRNPRKYERTGWSRGYLLRRYGVIRRPARAIRALLLEAGICAGQIARDRTAMGLKGRFAGWRAGGGLPLRSAPRDGLLELGLAERLRLRSQRRR